MNGRKIWQPSFQLVIFAVIAELLARLVTNFLAWQPEIAGAEKFSAIRRSLVIILTDTDKMLHGAGVLFLAGILLIRKIYSERFWGMSVGTIKTNFIEKGLKR